MPGTRAGERSLGRVVVWPVVLSWACAPGAAPPLQQVLSRPPIVVHHEAVTTRPLEVRNQKLYLEATVHGQTRTLLFDTGSPTMLDRRFAETLGLEVVGTNTGRDANGREVTMDVAVVDTLSLGGFAARRVPVLIFDFHQLHLGRCLFDGGVLGSELLAAAAWRIDTERGALDIGPSGSFPVPEAAVSLPLHDFGYPHAPVVDYRVGDVREPLPFDNVCSAWLLLGSVGHLLTNDDALRCFQNARKALADGGTLILELPHPRETFRVDGVSERERATY